MKPSALKILSVFGTRPEAIERAPLVSGMDCWLTLRFWLKACRIS